MGYFEISSKRDTDAAPLESRVLIADADIDRITVAYAELYFPNGVLIPGSPEVPEVPAVLDADGNVVTPAVPAVPAVPDAYRPPTGQEVFDAVANGLLAGILANTLNVEKTNAAKKAQEDIPPIPVGPGAV